MVKIYKTNFFKRVLFSLTFALSTVAVFAQGGGVPELLYYRFNSSTSGTTPNEANPATRVGGATGTLLGATVGGTGQFGSALLGNGAASGSNSVSSGWNLSLSGPWTIAMWFSGVTNSLSSNYMFGSPGGSTFRALTGSGVVAGAGNLEIRGTGMTDVFANGVFDATGTPVVIHYVYNPATLDIKVYKNGVYSNAVAQTATMALTGTSPFSAGGYGTNNGLPTGGKMDEFRLYNRALSAAEITQTWNKTLPLVQGPNNAGVSALTSPSLFCAGTQQVKVKIANKGSNLLDSVRVNWQLDGITQATTYWTSPLDTFGGSSYPNDTILTLGNVTFVSGVARTVKAWTSMPNGVADTINGDDTINVVLKASLNGTFTIGGASPDYPTLATAVTDLNNYGVCGPVVFNIRSGTYSGQAALGNIPGVSSTNTILIQSQANHRDSVTLTYSATATTDNYTLKLSNSNYIKIKDITVVATGTTYARALEIAGTSSFDTILNCSLITIASTASSANIAALFADPLTGGNNVIKNNGISGGSYGLFYSGTSTSVQTSNNVIEGNTIAGAGYYSAYIYYTLNTIFRNNTVTVTAPSYTTHYAVTVGYSDGPIEVTGNRVTATGLSATLYGMRIYYCDATLAQPGLIANNTITVQTSGTTYGFYCYNTSYQNYYHNSVNSISTGATNYAAYLYHSSATYNVNTFRNNIYANNSTTGYAMYVYNPLYMNGDYNLLYSTGVGLIYKGASTATAYANLNAYRTAFPTQEMNSLVYRPAFTSNVNPEPNVADSAVWAMNGRGIQNTLVTTDINGNPRPTTLASGVPDLGAYEFIPTSIPPLATMVAGPAITGYINQIYLFGGDTIARLVFDSVYGAPAFVHVRRMTGTVPPNMGISPVNYMYFYDSIYAPSGTYSYDMEMFYKDAWLGTMSNEGNMTIIKSINPPSAPWVLTGFTPSVDSTNNKITASALTSFGVFAGTDVSSPLPVKLLSLQANATSKSIHVNWITASEINSSHYNVERSTNGKLFEPIAKVKAAGNSKTYRKYAFEDVNGISLLSKGTVYYRLAIYDIDGKMEYSKTVAVKDNNKSGLNAEVFPNPFIDQLVLKIDNFEDAHIKVEIIDITGKLQYSGSFNGSSHIINNLDALPAGIYFAKFISNLEIKVVALIKR